MYVHIARQPIFDIHKKLFAYELLFRQTMGLQLGELSGDRATTSLLSTAFLTQGIDTIAGNKPCFINFTQNLLVKEIAASFPKNKVIIEILEDVAPAAEVIEACRNLSELGYIIALDDFSFRQSLIPLIELANIVKIDFRLSSLDTIQRTLHKLARFKLKYLAEKVESHAEFEQAKRLGFNYFQGYFFAQPESLRITEVPSNQISLLNLLVEINRPQASIQALEAVVAADVGIAYKLLRYINSAYFYLLKEVDSLRQAIIYLGTVEFRRFVNLVVISELAADKPEELIRLSVVRARFCQLLAEHARQGEQGSECFLLGLFSLIDAILDAPMGQMMDKMPLSDKVKEALIIRQGPLAPLLQFVLAYEQGQQETCLPLLRTLQIEEDRVYPLYLESIRYASLVPQD